MTSSHSLPAPALHAAPNAYRWYHPFLRITPVIILLVVHSFSSQAALGQFRVSKPRLPKPRLKIPKLTEPRPVEDLAKRVGIGKDGLPARPGLPTYHFFVENRTNNWITARVNYQSLTGSWTITNISVGPHKTELACRTTNRRVNVQSYEQGIYPGEKGWQSLNMGSVPQHFTYIFNRPAIDVNGRFRSQFGDVQLYNGRQGVSATVYHPNGNRTTLRGQRHGNTISFRFHNGQDEGSGTLQIQSSRLLSGSFKSFRTGDTKPWTLTR